MAAAVIEESGRPAFVCRKNRPDGDFVKHITAVFEEAAANAPSIVFLDDMDKFTNGDERYPDAEEYVTVQSCIDSVSGQEVFVLATVNNIRNLPDSLYRAGRFDRVLEVEAPQGRDAEQIIAHYLAKKECVEEMDVKMIARIMGGRSCAELETVINEAGLHAGFERKDRINMDHFMRACMRMVFDTSPGAWSASAPQEESLSFLQAVRHEAGHAVVSEILCPESVTLVRVYLDGLYHQGFTEYYNDGSLPYLDWRKSRIVGALGGAAAVEQFFGTSDGGSREDLDIAFGEANRLVTRDCICGMHLHSEGFEAPEQIQVAQDQATAVLVENYFRLAKEILAANREFFDKLSDALAKKQCLMMQEVQSIKASCRIVPFSL
jgi:cell division protease FtsH